MRHEVPRPKGHAVDEPASVVANESGITCVVCATAVVVTPPTRISARAESEG
jgi:hypothetical protein